MKLVNELRFVTGGSILDSNGNELLKLVKTTSAVNEVTFTNAATGTNPIISATGGDSSVGLDFQVKGTTGVYRFMHTAAASEVRMLGTLFAGSHFYSTGTASQSGTTVTGVGTTWTTSVIGKYLIFANGTVRTITGRTSNTEITVAETGTVASQAYVIHQRGLFVDSVGKVGIGARSIPTESAVFVYGGTNGANFDIRASNGLGEPDQALLELQGSDYLSSTQSLYLAYYGPNGTGTTLGYSNADLGAMLFQGTKGIISTLTAQPLIFGTNNAERFSISSTGVLANNGTTLTDTGGKVLSAALNTVAIAQGGTAGTTAQAARTNLLPSQTGNDGKILGTNGTDVSWVASSAPTPVAEVPTGTVNGSNTVFTLSSTPASDEGLLVTLDGVLQFNGIDFTLSGNTITFGAAPATGTDIFVWYNIVSGSTGLTAAEAIAYAIALS